MNYKQIADLISKSRKKTPAKVFVQGRLNEEDFQECGFQAFGQGCFWILIGDYPLIERWMVRQKNRIKQRYVEITGRNSALPLLDLSKVQARVEPGAVIREGARICKDCVIMMGAVINIGAEVGRETMIDMNAVLGARASIGKNCHIGAGAVIAGVLEPPSRKPVVIEDNVLVGANAVVLEGVRIGRGSVVAAGAVVLKDVPPGVVAAGVPAKVIKKVGEIRSKEKVMIIKSLRRSKR
ncbi:MAG: 2,3,4,5-tetrahydropyridine-2,6-dicarboxylate N-acetyltransferase [Candidatus Aminicenantales bacterium]